jgi:hypothetical protein
LGMKTRFPVVRFFPLWLGLWCFNLFLFLMYPPFCLFRSVPGWQTAPFQSASSFRKLNKFYALALNRLRASSWGFTDSLRNTYSALRALSFRPPPYIKEKLGCP